MKTIDVNDQPILSLRRTVQITANGIRYRLFRSAVTVVVVAVAVAFLMNILSESVIRKAVAERTSHRVGEIRCAAVWAGRLSTPGTVEEISLGIARARAGEPTYREAAAMGRFAEGEMEAYHASAKRGAEILAFFAGLDYARRRALVYNATGTDIFDRLQGKAAYGQFAPALRAMRSVRFPLSSEAFEEFLSGWPQSREQTLRIQRARSEAIATIAKELRGRPILEALTEADGPFGAAIRDAGFALDPSTAARVASQARRALDMRALEKTALEPEMRKAVAGYLDKLPGDVNARTMWDLLRERRTASWYLAKLRELGVGTAPPSVDRAVELARAEAEARALTDAEVMGTVSGGLMGIGERMTWLVLASMLVCVVGISNAMLMSVAERFREIATLKCLGALDGFIMLMFVLEACFLGLVGGVAGAVLGSVIGLGRALLAFGSLLLAAFPAATLATLMGLSVVLGIVLAAAASVYPSFKASRLAPMEAMRIQ